LIIVNELGLYCHLQQTVVCGLMYRVKLHVMHLPDSNMLNLKFEHDVSCCL